MDGTIVLVSSNPALTAPNILCRDGNFYPLTPVDGGVQLVVPASVYGDDLLTLGFGYPT